MLPTVTPDNSTALLTDMYELTMLEASLKNGYAHRKTVFELFGRRLPTIRRYGVVAGTGRILEAIARFVFTTAQLDYLANAKILTDPTLDYLRDYRFTGSIWGYREGECYFSGSPLLVVEGTFGQAVLLETMLLSIYNHDCAVASAASRMTIAAHGRPCLDMGARRTHERAGVSAARAAVVGGFAGTSCLEAGQRYDIPAIGTAAHSFTLLHDSEEQAFAAQIAALGTNTTLLVDTYDIPTGVTRAVEAARAAGGELGSVRIDSGDLVAQAFQVRAQLDALGSHSTKITVTSDLDEYAIAGLSVAPVDSYGVGTRLVTGSGIPSAALVYKLVSRQSEDGTWTNTAKMSAAKNSIGGRKYAGRVIDDSGHASDELVVAAPTAARAEEYLDRAGARSLLVPLVTDGALNDTYMGKAALAAAAAHHQKVRAELPYEGWRLSAGDPAIPTHQVNLY